MNGAAQSETRWQRHERGLSLGIGLVVVLTIVGGAAWWLLLSPIAVITHSVGTGTVTADVMGTGTLEARTSAIVGAKIGGLITRIPADQGDRVRAGELLIQLEDTDIRQQVGVAESESAAATATLARLRADDRQAEAVLLQAKLRHRRVLELAAKNVTAEEEVDKAVEALTIAEAGATAADAAIVEAEMRLAVAERSLAYQRARLDDTTVEAPFDGLVVRRDREPGDVVVPGASVLQVASTDEMWITAWVDETTLARLAEGQPARAIFRAEPRVEYPGVVARIAREVDRETRELVVDVRVRELPDTWAVGQRAEVYIATDRVENVTVVPVAFLVERDGRLGVITNERGRARWRPVRIGVRGRDVTEVRDGVSPGDVVVRPVQERSGPLPDGRRIADE